MVLLQPGTEMLAFPLRRNQELNVPTRLTGNSGNDQTVLLVENNSLAV